MRHISRCFGALTAGVGLLDTVIVAAATNAAIKQHPCAELLGWQPGTQLFITWTEHEGVCAALGVLLLLTPGCAWRQCSAHTPSDQLAAAASC